MFRTFDAVLIAIMTTAATVTYTIKHQSENKLEEVRRIEAEIRLEEQTLDLLRADWALLTQPARLKKLAETYAADLQLVPTESTQLVQPVELPMRVDELPPPEEDGAGKEIAGKKAATDKIATGSVNR
ncbi:hypothetical protein LXM94_05270 [Rhizobium sp. TRM95111]|uniref:cell division protein FtsL n=1 Tax=Rhizobium alarense TaxID=2846851 RepID=UPI001F2E106A|nr:hypothetical protein [Rhizobium alarense]MCF3639373.1 hypothetical protein [Rhizobium alarense]